MAIPGNVLLIDSRGEEKDEVLFNARAGCWSEDGLCLGSEEGLYLYDARLRMLAVGRVTELVYNPKPGSYSGQR